MKISKRDLCYEVTTTVARFANNMLADAVSSYGLDMPDDVRNHLKAAQEHLVPVMIGSAWRTTERE